MSADHEANLSPKASSWRPGVLGRLRARLLGTPAVSRKRKALAFAIAAAADVAQLALWPAFAGGAASPFDDGVDVVVAVLLLLTLGFSVRLALAFALELVPGADLFPTWTAVVASIPSTKPIPSIKPPTPSLGGAPPEETR